MEETDRYNNVTNSYIEITNPYAKDCGVQKVSFITSTSADGWKYHKKNKCKLRKNGTDKARQETHTGEGA